MNLKLHFLTFIRFFFSHCHVDFPLGWIPSPCGHCHVTFPDMEHVSFFVSFVQKVVVICFWDSFVEKATQQPDGSCNATSDSQRFYAKCSQNRLFNSASTSKKIVLSNENCNAHQDDKICFLPNCTITMYCWITSKSYHRNWPLCVGAHNKETEEWTEWPASPHGAPSGKIIENIYWAPSKKQNQRRQVDFFLQKELNKLKRQNKYWNFRKLETLSQMVMLVIVAIY